MRAPLDSRSVARPPKRCRVSRDRCRKRSVQAGVVSLMLISGALGGCQPTRTIAGYRNNALMGYRQGACSSIALEISKHKARVREWINETYRRSPVEAQALSSLFDALLVLANDQPDYRLVSSEYETYIFKEVLPPDRRPPLYLYPRVTHAQMATPGIPDIHSADPASPESTQSYWFIPAVLSRNALALDPPTRFRSFLHRLGESLGLAHNTDRESAEALLHRLRFFLEPRDGQRVDWKELPKPYLSTRQPFDDGFSLGLPDSSALGVAFALRVPDGVSESGFYNLRVLPILPNLEPATLQTSFGRAMAAGNWFFARDRLEPDRRQCGKQLMHDLRAVCKSAHTLACDRVSRHNLAYWQREVSSFAKACDALDHELNLCAACTTEKRLAHFARQVEDRIGELLALNDAPAPVYLDDGHDSEPFSFIVASDLQFHADEPAVERFFACVDGEFGDPVRSCNPPEEVRNAIHEAKFVLLAGDLADAAAGNAPRVIFWNALGLFPPLSPYTRLREFIELRRLLGQVRKPVFAVPGNHDGMVGYGGLLSDPLDFSAEFFNEFQGLRTWLAPALSRVNDFIPNGPKFHVPVTATMVPRQSAIGQRITPQQGDGFLTWLFAPRYDGLAEWRWYLGPLNVAFKYRGYTFVGLNSFNLAQPDRAGVGAVVDNWGGGVRAQDIGWLRAMLAGDREKGTSSVAQPWFLFMHHDPRGLSPSSSTIDFVTGATSAPDPSNLTKPAYDATDAWGSYATLGYVGLSYSPAWGVFIPIITPLCELCLSKFSNPNRFNQEWMQGYGGPELASTIADAAQSHSTSSSLVFFGHNDTPRPWKRGQILDSWKFAEAPREGGSGFQQALRKARGVFVKTRSSRSLPFQQEPDGQTLHPANGPSVVRLDDVGNQGSSHGFAVVTVAPKCHNVRVIYVPLPSGPPKAENSTQSFERLDQRFAKAR